MESVNEITKVNSPQLNLDKLKKEPSKLKRNLMEARMNLTLGLYLYEKTLSIYEYSVN